MVPINPDELLLAYRLGVFPMAETRGADSVLWVRPNMRCILPLNSFHVPKRLARTIRSDRFEIRCDTAFDAVIRNCAAAGPQRQDSWINPAIADVFTALHARGHAHSVETWEKGRLVGGLYGLSIGAVFFGESMFSHRTDASKVALVHLAARLKFGGYRLLDAQFPNPHLDQFGAVDIPEEEFEVLLEQALDQEGNFYSFEGASKAGPSSTTAPPSSPAPSSAKGSMTGSSGGWGGGASVMQLITQTS